MSARGRGNARSGSSRAKWPAIAAACVVVTGGADRAILTSGRAISRATGPARWRRGSTYQGEAASNIAAPSSPSSTAIVWRPSPPSRQASRPRSAGPKVSGGEASFRQRHRPVAMIRRISRSTMSGSSGIVGGERHSPPISS